MGARDPYLSSVGRRAGKLAGLLAALLLLVPGSASAAIDKQLVVADAFSDPVHVAQPPGDSTRLFVVEQGGTIDLIKNGALLPDPFLDIDAIVQSGGEEGLLSIAFPPNYGSGSGSTTRRFYVYFVNNNGDIRIKEYKRSQASGDVADPSYSRTVLAIPHPVNGNHNGGMAVFGPDGYLYAAPGDGGGQGDMPNNAQNKNVLLGKMLRIDPLPSGSKSHTNPPGNPYAGPTPGAGEIFARGFRNPWRFSFDGERLTVGDVGGGLEEEVDIVLRSNAKGRNFGWSGYEGNSIQNASRAAAISNPLFPDFSYAHGPGSAAIIGGYVVRDPALTEIDGEYVYADAYDGVLRSFELGDPAGTDAAVGETFTEPSSFGVDNADHVYVADRGADRVYRLIHTP